MKKLSIAVAMILGLGVTAVQAAETGTLNFSGNVISNACGIDASSLATNIVFDAIPQNNLLSLAAVGDTRPDLTKPFSIKLTGCPADAPISVKFEGSSYDDNIKGFQDNNTNSKANIAAMIFDAGTSTKVLPNQFVSKGVTTEGDNVLNYDVSLTRWWTGGNTTKKGTFAMAITYTMSYE